MEFSIAVLPGDGIGPDIWASAQRVIDSAVSKAYDNKKVIHWLEVYAGEKANKVYQSDIWLPDETLDMVNEVCSKHGRLYIKGKHK